MANKINVDNDDLKYNSTKLNNIRKRVSSLDSQIARLYWQTGNLDIWRIMKSNVIYKNNKKIKNIINALNNTANEFDATERSVSAGGLLLNGLDALNVKSVSVMRRLYISLKKAIENVGNAVRTNVSKITNIFLKYKKEYSNPDSLKNNFQVGACRIISADLVSSILDRTREENPIVTTGVDITNSFENENSLTTQSSSVNEKLKTYSYGNQNFSVIKSLEQKYCYNQNDYNRFWSNTYNDNVGCTSTSEAIAYSIYHNEEVSPNEMGWGSNGAKWNHSKTIEGTTNCSAAHTYKTIYENVKNGTPVMFRVKNAAKQNYGHHMTAVGIRQGADPNNLGPADILVVDPEKGKIESLADYTKGSYNKNTIIDNDGWPLRIPI